MHRRWIEEDMNAEYEAYYAFDHAVASGELVLGEDGYFHHAD